MTKIPSAPSAKPPIPREGEFAYMNVGYGATSYDEGDEIIGLQDGRLLTETFDRQGLGWDGQRWSFNSGLGLATYVVALSEVPEAERAGW